MDICKILVVEDDQNISELIGITLSNPQYAITYVDNGKAVLETLSREKPDLIILDILIPEPGGWKIYDFVRSNPEFNNVRVLVFSAFTFTPEFLLKQNIVSADCVMKKPFELEELRANVKKLINIA